jgi:hypothetical protein
MNVRYCVRIVDYFDLNEMVGMCDFRGAFIPVIAMKKLFFFAVYLGFYGFKTTRK